MNKFILKGLLYLFISFSFLQSSAQKFNVSWGDNAKQLKFDFDDAVLLSNGNYIILRIDTDAGMMREVKYHPTLILVDKDMKTLIEKPLEIPEGKTVIKGFNKYGENVFFVYSSYDKKSKTTSLFAIKIDDKTLEPISKTTLGIFESDKLNDQAGFTYKISSDSSKVLLLVKGPRRKKETEKIFLAVFDINLKEIWSRQVDLEIDQKYISVNGVDVSNDGKIYITVKHYENESTKETMRDEDGDKVPSYVYKMYIYENATAKEKILRLDFQGMFIEGSRIINNKEGLVTIAGLYKKKFSGRISGVFYGLVDSKTSEIKSPKIVEFPTSLLELIDKDGYGSANQKDPGLSKYFQLRYITYRENGSVDLTCEYYRLRVNTYTSSTGRTSTTYNYYYGDIVNTNINQQGEAVFTRVPKNQQFTNYTGYLSFYPIVYNDKLVLLYNDDKDNIERDLEKKPDDIGKFKKSVFVAATIDMKGNLTRQAIYYHKDESYITNPSQIRRISHNKYLLIGSVLKTFKFRTRFGLLEVK